MTADPTDRTDFLHLLEAWLVLRALYDSLDREKYAQERAQILEVRKILVKCQRELGRERP